MGGKTNYDPNSGKRLIDNIRQEEWRNAASEMDQLSVNLAEPMRNIGCYVWWPYTSGYNGPGLMTLQPFDTALYDNGGFLSPSLFVPIIPPGCAGPYIITGYIRLDAAGPSGAGCALTLLHNGIAVIRTYFAVSAYSSAFVTAGIYCEVGDRIDMGVFNPNAGFNIAHSGANNIDPYSPTLRLVLAS